MSNPNRGKYNPETGMREIPLDEPLGDPRKGGRPRIPEGQRFMRRIYRDRRDMLVNIHEDMKEDYDLGYIRGLWITNGAYRPETQSAEAITKGGVSFRRSRQLR